MNGNSRKRNASHLLFNRALSALNKNDTASPPKAKRARFVIDNTVTIQSSANHNASFKQRTSHRDASFNSFDDANRQSNPSSNFLSDHLRQTHSTSKNQTRHTPKTRMLSNSNHHRHKSYYDHSNTLNIKTRRNRNHHHHHRYDHNNDCDEYKTSDHSRSNSYKSKRGDYKYQKIEEKRMKKLWTDFADASNKEILSKLEFCADTSFFITSNSIAHKMSLCIKHILTHYFDICNDAKLQILDGLACIGGNSYSFAKIFDGNFHRIYMNELNVERYEALKHNMKIFENGKIIKNNQEKRLFFYNSDFLTLHENVFEKSVCERMDVIFLDPEWNRNDDYKQTNRGQIHLFDIGKLHLHQVVDNILTKWYVNVKILAIKVAKNYDRSFILRKFQKCKLIESGCYRIGEMSFHNQKLIVIVKRMDEKEEEDIDAKSGFDAIFESLPGKINGDGMMMMSVRDTISVKILA